MSLFDNIRYPVSMPPTKEELLAIPTEIYNKWNSSIFYSRIRPRGDIANAFKFIFENRTAHEIRLVTADVERLRKVIFDHGNNDGNV